MSSAHLDNLPTSLEFNIQELETKDFVENVAKWHKTCHLTCAKFQKMLTTNKRMDGRKDGAMTRHSYNAKI